jgi:hypothetical protein
LKNGKKTSEEGQLVHQDKTTTETDKELEALVSEAPPEVQELLKQVPPKIRREFTGMIMQTMRGTAPHPLIDKFTPEHVTKFLELNESDSNRGFLFASRGRWFQLGYALLAFAFLVFVIIYLMPAHKDLVISIITILVVFAGGFGAGYGYKSNK